MNDNCETTNKLVIFDEAANSWLTHNIVATTGIIPGHPHSGGWQPWTQHTGGIMPRYINQEIVKAMEGGVIHYCDKHGNMVSKSIKDLTQEEADCIVNIAGKDNNPQQQSYPIDYTAYITGQVTHTPDINRQETTVPENNYTITYESSTKSSE